MKREIRISERGFSQWIIILILMVGIGVGVWVAQIRTNLVPQAAPQAESTAETSMSLKLEDQVVQLGQNFRLRIQLQSQIDSVRLVSSQLKYDPALLDLIKVETPPQASISAAFYATASAQPKKPQITHWLETLFNNAQGTASLTGLFEQADFKTNAKDPDSFLYATLVFRPKAVGETEVKIENSSVMLRAADNANILVKRNNLKLKILESTNSATEPN